MTLIEQAMDECVLINRVIEDDGYGGVTDSWNDGAHFKAMITQNTTSEVLVAQQQGIKEIFIVVTQKGFPLRFHYVFRRVKDGQVFRVTGDNSDNEAPEASTIRIAKVTAEKWVIPA